MTDMERHYDGMKEANDALLAELQKLKSNK